ncbi:MAG: AcvB/VirJ family lysyl-phosphatidylglycerol hydrolase [Steroidobacteraceae bacterium]
MDTLGRAARSIGLSTTSCGHEAYASLCTTAAAASHKVVRKSGAHHFDRNYSKLANEIGADLG